MKKTTRIHSNTKMMDMFRLLTFWIRSLGIYTKKHFFNLKITCGLKQWEFV